MNKANHQPNLLHDKLISLAACPTGFGVSELTGYTPEQVRRAAESLVKEGRIVRSKVSPRRIRYFQDEQVAKRFVVGRFARHSMGAARSLSAKATWKPGEPAIITSKTKIYVAPPLPRNVFRSNTYLQF